MDPLVLYVLDLAADEDPARFLQRVDPRGALLTATDLSAARGDGIFETIVVIRGVPQALEEHLDRFQRSARLLDLPAPSRELWRHAVLTAADDLSGRHPRAAVKIVLSRGDEAGDGVPTGWALGFASLAPAAAPAALDVVLLDRGYRHDVAETSPWLLQGAKTLSYAINMAALREAARRGAQDVVFVSSDGFVLEGPTSTLVARIDGEYVTPPAELGVLPGTTQADVFAGLRAWGEHVSTRPLMVPDLLRADAAWLCSSVRGAAAVRSIDGAPCPVDDVTTARLRNHLDARRA
ncbi:MULTISPECIES: aminodeoxychorismate lyase [unclassified Microbacterium]|uniref:aminodeoxychorismate lyase n=1 Tax=unclassified Microbacterium TaxID=2609290 RepID=UPI00214A95D3|nr:MULTISPECIES: aminodeoxychorismate lyase [unclassified Microbacterium]MCR2784723.1 aminodeoxychorismate lyase [Microbacterium sp. zg.B96]MDL5352822.1 aminodeoxychorismate lyase [Microbacterium sp. zg-YB36]WIM16262.1 aminodeoxychorismate lyase [Microbacterium sp. zg-B96]